MSQMYCPHMDSDFWGCRIKIKQNNCAKAAKAIRDAGLSRLVDGASSKAVIENALYTTDDGVERVLKVIAEFIEPGSVLYHFDFGKREDARYYFNGDSIERWTGPDIVYSKKEAIWRAK